MRFLDLSIAEDVPDSKTVWKFREQLTDLGLTQELFTLFLKSLEKLTLMVNEWKIVDVSFIEVLRGRNSRDENKQLKQGEAPQRIANNPHVKSPKDLNARWTQKSGVNYFGSRVMSKKM